MSGATSTQRHERNDDIAELDEAGELRSTNGLLYDKAYETAEKFAATYIGQYATEKVDRLLKLIEDTAKWSLPQNRDKNDSTTPLERPLPWIPFIAMILMLRMIRLSLSVGGLFIGNAPIVPADVVYFIQTRRRKLRAIRINGMRDIRKKEQASGQKGGGIIAKLQSILSIVVCRPGQGRDLNNSDQKNIDSATTTEKKTIKAQHKNKEAKLDYSDQNLTLDEILDKFGNVPSDDDSDFIPPSDALSDAGISSESTSSATSESEGEESVSEITVTNEATKAESDVHMTNGNKRSQASVHSNENQADSNIVEVKENGEHFSRSSRRPIPLPKPYKQEQMPIPIQEIKQEPLENDGEKSSSQHSQQDPSLLKRSNEEQLQPQQQQSVVAPDDANFDAMDEPRATENTESKINGDENSHVINAKSEVFLTPATSTEDLFFSPVGSPNLSGNFGFQPTSILKNSNTASNDHKRREEPFKRDTKIDKAEVVVESIATSTSHDIPHQPAKANNFYSGKNNKNRFRGKRR